MDSAERPVGASQEGALSVPAPELPASAAEAETYRPLNVLSMIGFALAASFAALICFGSIASYFSRSALLLPSWIALWPMLGLALSYLARVQIQSSEDTRSGLPLTNWGIGLCLFFGMSYWAYFFATGMAVEQQASEALERWFKLVEDGKNEEAFLMTLNPTENALPGSGQSDLREIVETRHNTSPGESLVPGAYSFMLELDYYRYIQQGGDKTKTKLVRVEEWGLKDGKYRVRLRYQIETPAVSFELSQMVEGVWPIGSPRRIWYVSTYVQESGRPADTYLKFTSDGKQVLENWSDRPQTGGRAFVQSWLQTLTKVEPNSTFLGTLPPSQKRKLQQLQVRGLPLGSAFFMATPEAQDLRAKYDTFLSGALVQADDQTFFCDAKIRSAVIAEIKRAFTFEGPVFQQIRASKLTEVPRWEVDDKVASLNYGVVGIVLIDEPGKASAKDKKLKVIFEGRVYIQADRQALDSEQADPWRVIRFELLRARTLSNSAGAGRPNVTLG